jgi:hypothetical protein
VDAVLDPPREARLLDDRPPRREREVGGDAQRVLAGDADAQHAEWLHDLDRDRAIGPTRVSARSTGARREARSAHCRPPRTTLNAASITRRFGYRPIAAAKKRSPVFEKPLKK